MATDFEDDFSDEDYFSEVTADAELTGKEPKFVRVPSLDLTGDSLSTMKVDELVATYRAVRDQYATDSKAFRARQERLKLHMAVIGLLLRDKGDVLGVDSFSTPSGTAYRHRTEKFPIQDWESLSAYVLRTGNIHILQKRVSPNAIREIREVDGALPPGLEAVEEVTFSVRSPTARRKL